MVAKSPGSAGRKAALDSKYIFNAKLMRRTHHVHLGTVTMAPGSITGGSQPGESLGRPNILPHLKMVMSINLRVEKNTLL